jgi:predicted RNA binding protein YcfA (HicA-like mRNA interferase family)
MPKLRAFSGAELCNLLSEHGFERVRQRRSHVIMRRGQISFPVPLHRQLPRHALKAEWSEGDERHARQRREGSGE